MDAMSTVIAELNDDLERCRRERLNAERVRQIENERLQEILILCQWYNETNINQTARRFADVDLNGDRDLRCTRSTPLTAIAVHENNNNDAKNHNYYNNSRDLTQTRAKPFESTSSRELPTREALQLISELSTCTLNSRNSGSSNSSASSSANDDTNANLNKNTSCESLNALLMEEALICGELQDIQHQQFSDCDAEDEDLREFQRIEKEIKVSELTKCLHVVQKQINHYHKKRDSLKSKQTENTELPSDYTDAPLAESESIADEQSTETEKDSQDFKNDDNSSLDTESLSPVCKPTFNKKSQQRPLTLYLPSPDEELNLVNHIQTLGHDLTNQPSLIMTPFTCSGYLYKLCSNSESKWRKRFFHFDRQHKVFVYYRSNRSFKKMRKPSGGVYFDEIHDVYVDHSKMKTKNGDNSGSRCVFIVGAATRQFVLSTFQPELMRIWIDVVFTGAQAYQDFNDS